MVKQAPTFPRLMTMVLFALSCFGLLLFLWISFGGPVPLKAKGYRFAVDFPEAVSLSEQADVRISGVNVGKVVKLVRTQGRTHAVLQMDPRYAPIPVDTQAILRVKTLLGETFVALSPGDRTAPKLREGATLPDRNVHAQVELDEVLRSFDPPTRRALQDWVHGWSAALDGRSQSINDVLGNLAPTAEHGASVLAILDAQHAALRRLVSDTGHVFAAIGSREGDLQGLITAGDRLFATTASRERALSDTIDALPPFMTQARATLRTAQAAAREADPVLRDLEPAAGELRPTLQATAELAPQAELLFKNTAPLIPLSAKALPAATSLLKKARPLVQILLPIGEDLVPVSRYLLDQRDQLLAGQANVPSVLNATAPSPTGQLIHYLRAITFFAPEGLVGFGHRQASNRRNPYLRDRGLDDLKPGSAIKTYDCDNLGNGDRVPPPEPPPPCNPQGPFSQFGNTDFPHLVRDHP
jgi:phospholipid/cholesterol/gamma-HCH transport system substrate-binding protein